MSDIPSSLGQYFDLVSCVRHLLLTLMSDIPSCLLFQIIFRVSYVRNSFKFLMPGIPSGFQMPDIHLSFLCHTFFQVSDARHSVEFLMSYILSSFLYRHSFESHMLNIQSLMSTLLRVSYIRHFFKYLMLITASDHASSLMCQIFLQVSYARHSFELIMSDIRFPDLLLVLCIRHCLNCHMPSIPSSILCQIYP